MSVGFLRTYSSRAVAELSCVRPCACAPTNLSAYTGGARTSTTVFSRPLAVEAPNMAGGGGAGGDATCELQLRVLTKGEAFKFIALQVS